MKPAQAMAINLPLRVESHSQVAKLNSRLNPQKLNLKQASLTSSSTTCKYIHLSLELSNN